jgi:MarR family transcriptional regulator for hemolysin
VTFRQAQVLGCLALEGSLSQTGLADRMRIEPPTLVGILDRMERDGWIRRDADKTDRRRKLIQPTPAAKPAWSITGSRGLSCQVGEMPAYGLDFGTGTSGGPLHT